MGSLFSSDSSSTNPRKTADPLLLRSFSSCFRLFLLEALDMALTPPVYCSNISSYARAISSFLTWHPIVSWSESASYARSFLPCLSQPSSRIPFATLNCSVSFVDRLSTWYATTIVLIILFPFLSIFYLVIVWYFLE